MFMGAEVPEEAVREIVSLSDQLTNELLEQVRHVERYTADTAELESAILATAAVDAAVSADVLSALQGEAEREFPGTEVPSEVIELTPWSRELEPIELLLARADNSFPEMAGAALDLSPPQARAERAIGELLESATPVAIAFGTSVLRAGGGTLAPALGGVFNIHQLAERLIGRLGGGCRLISNALRKLVGLIESDTGRELTADLGLEDWQEALSTRVDSFGKGVVQRLVRVKHAQSRVADLLQGSQEVANAPVYDAELAELCHRYAENMHSAGTISKRLRKAAPVVIVVSGVLGGGPAGGAAVAAANGIGLAYTLFSLADRLDTMPGWVPGVPMIVKQNLGRRRGPRRFSF